MPFLADTFIYKHPPKLTMVNRVLQPQEVEVFYVIPAIRRELTRSMKEAGKSQKQIARLLGVTEPAISQYLSEKRASGLKFTEKISALIKEAAVQINDEQSMVREVQKLLSAAREERIVCQVHASLGNVPKDCNLCFEDSPIQINRG